MRIVINDHADVPETEIIVNCAGLDESLIKLLATLRAYDWKITGLKDGQTFLLDAASILYIESVDKRTFLYTRGAVYETPLRLYELEERLAGRAFFRASKASIVNFDQIQSLKPDFGGRIQVTMSNGEKLFVSRQYAPEIKRRLEGL